MALPEVVSSEEWLKARMAEGPSVCFPVFNGLQMVNVLPELERLAATDPESRVMKRVVELAQRRVD